MRARRAVVSYDSIVRATDNGITFAECNVARSIEYLTDVRKKARLQESECRWCYYFQNSRVGGAAMTHWQCGVCAKEMIHHSTAVPRLCKDCGKKYDLCVECGGDLHQRIRRKYVEIPIVPYSPEESRG